MAMSSTPSTTTAWWMAGLAVLASGVVGYAVYFDYRRRNDAVFRRMIKKQKARVQAEKEKEIRKNEEQLLTWVKEALELVKDCQYPTSPADRERFFVENLQNGEVLLRSGTDKMVEAAVCIYKALKMYPQPLELLTALQKTLPEEIITLLYSMISTEASVEVQAYFHTFSNRFPHLKVHNVVYGGALAVNARCQRLHADRLDTLEAEVTPGVVTTREFHAKHPLILADEPIATCPLPTSDHAKPRCDYCMGPMPAKLDPKHYLTCSQCSAESRLVFCTSKCFNAAQEQYHAVLCVSVSSEARELRQYCVKTQDWVPWMIVRFICRMVHKQTELAARTGIMEQADDWEHLERLPGPDVKQVPPKLKESWETECQLVRKTLKRAAPGAEDFLDGNRYTTIRSRFTHNCMGIQCAEDVNSPMTKTLSRSQHADTSIHGLGLFPLASRLRHSCNPNAQALFQTYQPEQSPCLDLSGPRLVVKPLREIAVEEEITLSYVPMDMSPADRDNKLLRGWNCMCRCEKCMASSNGSRRAAGLDVSTQEEPDIVEEELLLHGGQPMEPVPKQSE